ncbi:hypothetical protein [uncultured Gammaproteobacteria bacterium]|uniref:hypothetical protein n=1 Tax=Bathymodiolus heckerae thiotrophic gill symbiont TaxID=1052212 RepID=UPI0010B2A994|nr:hypothetical protein [Bathymodiolus heckerae thiotrophic gill symbiont]CAC9589610.1 hypothetical protein [uncultured Gammaproteobacteria bacterium]CAC9595666.1 hypothetical protein [uncultured Gammaproteobacteria bacterium]CAC9954904.1 hypothetical protein [uncultured Gammaproteobacteria bacterium]CAC9959265.1 hypothetical protein [uncultured Gammaproteobacteria bacterium]SHN91207.1 hypothetical protein BHECKSOX_1448 [Bathymodiolus heckerae thiotrophic gill symbiont]
MKLILNTFAVTTLLLAASTSAQSSAPYATFNPLAMFEAPAHNQVQQVNSAFYNYGNKGYDFVVESAPMSVAKLPQQVASLGR